MSVEGLAGHSQSHQSDERASASSLAKLEPLRKGVAAFGRELVGGAEDSVFLCRRAFKTLKLNLAGRCPSLVDWARCSDLRT
jgi:hypothetical protein